MTHTRPIFKAVTAHSVSTPNNKPTLIAVFIKAIKRRIGNSWSNPVVPTSCQQHCKLPPIIYLFYPTDKQTIHFQTGCTEFRCTLPTRMSPSPTTSTGRSILAMMNMNNRRVPWISPQRNKMSHAMACVLLSDVLLCEVERPNANRRTGKASNTSICAG